ncbi:transient receptor potential cation channel protein painless isoform X2 [Nasonia vitripennis]|uniref:Ion transport domain-containing protein n=1 Tax=Nasonia vitripennis TaxID=7425 RepID=A0A7M7IPZ1_NASVI|nr:transient receptor potential cation channel protein painless isoform X2 [Nasonia vitripennis]
MRCPKMDSEDEALEMQLLQEQNADRYTPLMHLLKNNHLATFKSFVRQALNRQPPSIDVNHLLSYPEHRTFLDAAASLNLPNFVAFLLEVGANPNLINSERNRAPIHFAAEAGHSEALEALLKDRRVNLNLEAGGLTALHYAVKADCGICTRLLLDAGASPNIPNGKGITALHMAAEKNSREMVQLIIENSTYLDLDTFRDRKKDTARTIIEKKFPDLAKYLPTESSVPPDPQYLLKYYLSANDEANFLKVLGTVEDLNGLGNKSELLRQAVEKNLRATMKEMLERDGLMDENLYEIAKVAVERGHPEILKELLKKKPKIAERLLMSACQELGVPSKPGPGNRNNRFECLRMIMEQGDIDVRQEDDKGNSPLHYAARAENREAIELLLQKGCYVGHMNSFGSPPLAHMAPGILEPHLDECLTSSNERTEEYEIIMNYQNLVPHNTQCGADVSYLERNRRRSSFKNRSSNPCSETEALLFIANNKSLRHLLKHPLLASFLYLKYLRIRHVLYVNFFLYLVYFFMLISYIWVITSEAELEAEELRSKNLTSIKPKQDDDVDVAEEENGMFANLENHPIHSALLFAALIYMIVRELLQFISSPLHYIGSPENWIEITLIGLTGGLLLGGGVKLGSLAALLSTWELVILMSQHPRMSTDIEMFKTVTLNFARFLFLYVFLILAFAFAFFVLFRDPENENFVQPPLALFKTIIMLTGEFDSSDLPFSHFPVLSRLVFCGFIFLIVIILLNLLNGLAVNDTAEILSQAELVCLISRARLVAYAERIAVGQPFVPKTRLCCFINYLPCQSLTTGPVRFMARRILLFPRYLPHFTLSVKPLKNYEITLHGRPFTGSRCSTLKMDPVVAQRAKEILEAKGRVSSEDKILEEIETMRRRFDGIEAMVREIRETVRNNNLNAED